MTMVRRYVNSDEEKAMRCSLERELQLHAYEQLLAPKEEPQDDVEQPHEKEKRWVDSMVEEYDSIIRNNV